MEKVQRQVREFHAKVLAGPTSPAKPELRHPHLRASLIMEEAIETAIALVGVQEAQSIVHAQLLKVLQASAGSGEPNLVDAIDGCIDLIYVTYGTLEDIGVDGEPFVDEVHAANMRKVDPGHGQQASKTPLGKVIKPAGWVGPDIAGVLEKLEEERLAHEAAMAEALR